MPLKYLQELEQATLPLTVTDPDAVRKVELLRTALLIDAKLRAADAHRPAHSAVVYAITPLGWAYLERRHTRSPPR